MLEIEPVKRSQLTSQVIDRIKTYIESNQLEAGAKLPGERELARTLGVSRNVTREAIRALQATGILDIQPGNGVFVAEFDYGEITSHLSFAIGRKAQGFKHWVEARAAMERAIVELAVPRITPAQIERLEASIEQLDRAESFEEDMAADLEFHRCLVEVTGNPVLIELMSFLAQFFQEASRLKGSRFGGVDEHREVIAAIKQKNAKEAGRLMEEHIRRWNQVA
jgi:DNA-binding FadR family transcriptional regulator